MKIILGISLLLVICSCQQDQKIVDDIQSDKKTNQHIHNRPSSSEIKRMQQEWKEDQILNDKKLLRINQKIDSLFEIGEQPSVSDLREQLTCMTKSAVPMPYSDPYSF